MAKYIGRPRRQLLQATDCIYLDGERLGGGADFWRWACSDLRGNTIRGLFAEWLVGLLLGLELDVREDWVGYDHRAGDLLIEVKCAAYLQNWAQTKLSKPVFGSLRNLAWNPETNVWTTKPAYNCHWYIFCVHISTDADNWNVLDLEQWEFYLVARESLSALGLKTLSLNALRRFAEPWTARQHRSEGRLRLGIHPGQSVSLTGDVTPVVQPDPSA